MPEPEEAAAGRLLLTVFEPFGGAAVNASKLVGEALAAADPSIELLCLPVVIGEAERKLIHRLETGNRPGLIVSLGEAGPEPVVRLEKVAINYDDFRLPDNGGNQPRAQPIRADGPTAHFATLPLEEAAARLTGETPVPVKVSLTAGAFLCNHLSYAALDWLSENHVCGYSFVHIPCWRPDTTLDFSDLTASVNAVINSFRTA